MIQSDLTLAEIVSRRLRELIERSDEGIAEHARRSGIPYPTLISWVRGNKLPSGEGLCDLADYFGVSVDYLLGRVSQQTVEGEAIYKDLGLTEEAVRALQRFKREDKLLGSPLIPGKIKSMALSKALASTAFLEAVTAIIGVKRGSPGYYEGTIKGGVKDATEDFYLTELSPDSLVALLYHRLQLTMQQIRTGEEPPAYEPQIVREATQASAPDNMDEERRISRERAEAIAAFDKRLAEIRQRKAAEARNG